MTYLLVMGIVLLLSTAILFFVRMFDVERRPIWLPAVFVGIALVPGLLAVGNWTRERTFEEDSSRRQLVHAAAIGLGGGREAGQSSSWQIENDVARLEATLSRLFEISNGIDEIRLILPGPAPGQCRTLAQAPGGRLVASEEAGTACDEAASGSAQSLSSGSSSLYCDRFSVAEPDGGYPRICFHFGRDPASMVRAEMARETSMLLAISGFIPVLGYVAVVLRRQRQVLDEGARATHEGFERVLDSLPVGCIEWDAERRLVSMNRAAQRIFGVAGKAVQGTRFLPGLSGLRTSSGGLDSVHEADGVPLPDDVTRLSFDNKLGRTTFTEWESFELPGGLGESPRFLSLVADVTERQELIELQRRTDRLHAIGKLSGGIAHDINNALSPTLLALDMLRADASMDPDMLELMSRGIDRCIVLIARLRDFTKDTSFVHRAFDARSLLDRLQTELVPDVPSGISFIIDPVEFESRMIGNPDKVFELLRGLCLNACAVMPEGGALEVSSRRVDVDTEMAAANPDTVVGPYVALMVRDSGPGLPEGVLEHLSEPFFAAGDESVGNTGIRLPQVVSVTRSHGGFVMFDSQPGVGTTVTLHLPNLSID